jgi:protein-tyrosine phosphatase
MESKPLVTSKTYTDPSGGFLALSQCPGKKLARGRDGKPRNRDLEQDVRTWVDKGVRLVVCLLNQSELRSLGVVPAEYPEVALRLGVQFRQYPIIEMAAPGSIEELIGLLRDIDAVVTSGAGALVHCRGGIGRAGTIAACYLLYKGAVRTAKAAIEAVRRARDPRCVESRRQADFISSYVSYLASI